MSQTGSTAQASKEEPESPPFLGSWKKVYLAVLAYLALLIAVLMLLTRWLDPTIA